MIDAKRLEELSYQASHKGMSTHEATGLRKRGIDPDRAVHGAMIVVTSVEMQELLDAYFKVHSEQET